jgi:hypothetical protein
MFLVAGFAREDGGALLVATEIICVCGALGCGDALGSPDGGDPAVEEEDDDEEGEETRVEGVAVVNRNVMVRPVSESYCDTTGNDLSETSSPLWWMKRAAGGPEQATFARTHGEHVGHFSSHYTGLSCWHLLTMAIDSWGSMD